MCESITIRKFEHKDIANKVRWINDPENNRFLHYDLPLEYEKTCIWFEKNKDRTDRYDAVIEADGQAVGLIGLLSIDHKNRKAEYYISMGEPAYKGKGVASAASELLLDYAFVTLGLEKVYLYTETDNIAAQKLFRRLGFKEEGVLKKDLFSKGKFVDRFAYGITRDEYLPLSEMTPIQCLGDLDGNPLFIKREDLLPYSFGGNKARKAQLFFADIDKGNYDCVVTYGTSHSNHCRVIANMAAARKMPCCIIGPAEVSDQTFNSRFMELFGAEIVSVPVEQVHDTIENKLAELKRAGRNPYFIAGGGHGNLGTQAYVNCYEEICRYERENQLHFDYIFFASGTGTTQAGLVCGQLMHGDDRNLVGISIARKNPRGRDVVIDSIHTYLTAKKCEVAEERIQDRTIFVDDYIGDGYGIDNADIEETIKNAMIQYGIPLDSTYTGKAFLGMKRYIREAGLKGKRVLFIHTGGTPLFFDDLGRL